MDTINILISVSFKKNKYSMKSIKVILFIIFCIFFISCSDKQEKPVSKDEKEIEFYKQFDSTITKEQLISFKSRMDSLNRWKDSKRKGHRF